LIYSGQFRSLYGHACIHEDELIFVSAVDVLKEFEKFPELVSTAGPNYLSLKI